MPIQQFVSALELTDYQNLIGTNVSLGRKKKIEITIENNMTKKKQRSLEADELEAKLMNAKG